MTETSIAKPEQVQTKDKLIVALDVETASQTWTLIAALAGEVAAFKIGLQLFVSAGPAFVKEIVDSGQKVFLDLKFHDIPNTVAKAAVEAARLGAWMFNVHTLGGREMMLRTVEEVNETCERENLKRPKIIGVTILTSSNTSALGEVGIEREVEYEVLKLAVLAAECGLDGVVASPLEIKTIRNAVDKDFMIVTPGIRPGFATNDDQKRVMTPGEAIAEGSDYLVIGRPITQEADRLSAVRRILEEINAAG